MSPPSRLSTTEYAVLGVLAEAPTHGFAISKSLAADSGLGRVFTVRRPLVYRALDRLVEEGLATAVSTEPGRAGPKRVIHRVTPAGERRLNEWLTGPVGHVRDLRIEFLLKLTFLERKGLPLLPLIRSQRAVLDSTLAALRKKETDAPDHVELWRRHNAASASGFLTDLEDRESRKSEVE